MTARNGNSETPSRLSRSTSPYLLDHAHNPVDWWPWGEAAFSEARRRDVPIFLSVGYSTCYWCHVMARESFEDAEIAQMLNESFVCIKVDREERPDLDDLYMAATLVTTGRGGWPMTVFIEPDRLRPFYCGTYFPARPSERTGTHPTLVQLAEGISRSWHEQRERVLESAEAISQAVEQELSARHEPTALTPALIEQAAQAQLSAFDAVDGGFGGAPKFPQPVNLVFLMDLRERVLNDDARTAMDTAIRKTLDAMACGGLFDQVGGGFHRYAVDKHWHVPHFEKMLYDNAQLLGLCARAAKVYTSLEYERIARRIVEYLDREMTAEDGAFYSAQDAEVDGHEGQNYVWTAEQVREVLGDEADEAMELYGLDNGPNFRDPHHPDSEPVNVLRLEAMPGELAARAGIDREALVARIDALNERLLEARSKRPQARLDDKVLASWNGLMISGLAEASVALEDASMLDRAKRACLAVRTRLIDDGGGLLRVSRGERAHTAAFLEDYAIVAGGLAATVRAGRVLGLPCEDLLTEACRLVEQADARLAAPDGGYFDAAGGGELFVRPRTTYDGATPTGSSAMLHTLMDLAELTGDRRWADRAVRAAGAISGQLASKAAGMLNATRALLRMFDEESVRAQLAALGPALEPDTPLTEGDEDFTPVEVYADRDSIEVKPDSPAELWLELRIAPGFHVVAGDPGKGELASSLLAMRVFLLEGSGVRVFADYPEGEPWGEDRVLVHTGVVRVRAAMELDPDAAGEVPSARPLLGVRFQACDERSCRLPTTVELDVSVDLG